MAKYKITGVPNKTVPKVTLSKVLGPVNKKIANVEAEKGETVVTNMSRGLNNIYEMYDIGGKKHSQGGTPLALPTDSGTETDGTSFIFSDNKKMIVKDPAILEYFGVSGNKPKTFAEISKSWLPSINASKQILINPDSDKITRKSAEMSMDNAAFKIAALKLLQESKKGMKDGVPNGLSPFFDKLQINPADLFAMGQEQADNTNQAVAKAFGGMANSFSKYSEQYPFPSLSMGGQLPRYGGGGKVYTFESLPKDAEINTSDKLFKVGQFVKQPDGTYLKVIKVNVEPKASADTQTSTGPVKDWIAKSPENKAAAEQANAIIEKGIKDGTISSDGRGGIKILGNFNPGFKDRILLSRVINQSGQDFATDKYKITLQRRTTGYSGDKDGKIKGSGSFVAGFTPDDYEKRYIFEKLKGQGSTDDEAFASLDAFYKDPAKTKEIRKEYLGFLGIPLPKTDEELMSSDFYKKNYSAVTTGIETKLGKAGYRPAIGDEQLSGFEHFDAFGFTGTPEYETGTTPVVGPCDTCDDGTVPVRNPDGSCTPCINKPPQYKGLGQTTPLINPYGFRREDIASLNRATQARFEIPEIHPWAKSAQVVMPDRAYYSPERAIAAKNEQLNQVMQGVGAFGNAQSAGATGLALSGQAYVDVANDISNYADKNINIFNQGENYNTQLANTRNAQDSALQTNMYDKESTLKQALANSVSAAKDKIVQLSNQAFTNASNIYNLNLTNENFKKDPFSGLISKVNDRAITPTKDTSKEFGVEFNDFAKSMPTVNPDLQMKAFLAMKSGKYVIEKDDEIVNPNDLNNTNLT
jgi:hypothetical protein